LPLFTLRFPRQPSGLQSLAIVIESGDPGRLIGQGGPSIGPFRGPEFFIAHFALSCREGGSHFFGFQPELD
jgi:hypothetical protein